MKKFIALMLLLALCLTAAACGRMPENNGPDGAQNQNGTQNQNGQQNSGDGGTASDPLQSKYDQIIQWLKEGQYSAAVGQIQQMEKDAIKAENAKKGIREVTITQDNWSEYFEIADTYSYNYYYNSFKEITTLNCSTGLKLKDGYKLVLDDSQRKTSVAFEAELVRFYADVTYDFTAGICVVGEKGEQADMGNSKLFTTTYTPNVYMKTEMDPGDGIAGIGYSWQGLLEDGPMQKEVVSYIQQVTRAQGTLYIYEN